MRVAYLILCLFHLIGLYQSIHISTWLGISYILFIYTLHIGLIGYLAYQLYVDQENNPVLTTIKTTTKNIEELDFPTGQTIIILSKSFIIIV